MGQSAKKRHRFTSEVLAALKETLRGLEGLKMISPDDPSVAPLRKDLQEKIDELEGKSATHPERKAAA